MKTLADLKRITLGTKIQMIFPENNSHCGKIREVTKVQTNAIKIGESYLEFPRASLLEFTDNGFKIFHPGTRELTEHEKSLIRNEPRDEKQEEIDCLTDGSTMFYRRKAYYRNNNAEYLFGGDKNRRIDSRSQRTVNVDEWRIIDSSIKGELMLEYKFI